MSRPVHAAEFVCLGCAAMPGRPCVSSSGRPYRVGGYVHHDRLMQAIRAEQTGYAAPQEPTHEERTAS